MIYKTLDDFITHNASKNNACFYYNGYPKKIKMLLKNIYSCCFRFNLYSNQILFILDKALEPFSESNTTLNAKDLLNL